MTKDRFVRVSDRLYEEDSGTKWAKAPEPFHLQLYDAIAIDGVAAALKTPSFFRKKDEDFNGLDDFTITADPSQLRAIKEIRAKGTIENADIGFIDAKGVTDSGLLDRPKVYVELIGVSDEELRQGPNGNFAHFEANGCPFLLGTVVPKSAFDDAWTNIRSGVARQVSLQVYVAVFQPEVERALGDPGMHQVYYIEKEKSGNPATFSELRVSSAPVIPQPVEPQDQKKISGELAVLNRIAGSMRVVAGGIIAVAALLLIGLLK